MKKKMEKILGYEELVKRLAVIISTEQIDVLELEDLKEMAGAGYEKLDLDDWHELLCDIKREQRMEMHNRLTAKVIFDSLPYAAQQAAQQAVKILLRKAKEGKLYSADETVDAVKDILWYIFYCMGVDIKDTVSQLYKNNVYYSQNDLKANKLLLDFIKILRDKQWYQNGDVTMLRTRKTYIC